MSLKEAPKTHQVDITHEDADAEQITVAQGPTADRLGRFASRFGFDQEGLAAAGVLRAGDAQVAEMAARAGQVDSLSSAQMARAAAIANSPDFRAHPH